MRTNVVLNGPTRVVAAIAFVVAAAALLLGAANAPVTRVPFQHATIDYRRVDVLARSLQVAPDWPYAVHRASCVHVIADRYTCAGTSAGARDERLTVRIRVSDSGASWSGTWTRDASDRGSRTASEGATPMPQASPSTTVST